MKTRYGINGFGRSPNQRTHNGYDNEALTRRCEEVLSGLMHFQRGKSRMVFFFFVFFFLNARDRLKHPKQKSEVISGGGGDK